MSIQTTANERTDGFDLNQIGSQIVMRNVSGDWARFSVASIGASTTWGSTIVVLEGHLDPAAPNDEGWFELNTSARLTEGFGISPIINVTGIPSLRVRVDTAQGSSATFARGRITVADARY